MGKLTPSGYKRRTMEPRLDALMSAWPGLGNRVSYYRDDRGLEVKAIVERGDRWAGIEVKLSDTTA